MPYTNIKDKMANVKKCQDMLKAKKLCLLCWDDSGGRTHCDLCRKKIADRRRRRKQVVIDTYGGKCKCCGISNFEFLSIDHINNDGAKDRQQGITSQKLITKIIRDGFPDLYQVLCYNCHLALSYFGFCPHHPEVHRPRALDGRRRRGKSNG